MAVVPSLTTGYFGDKTPYVAQPDRGPEWSDAELHEFAALHLALLAVPGVGTLKALGLLEQNHGIGNVAGADDEVGAALRRNLAAARTAVGRAVAAGIDVVPFEHPGYPLALFCNVRGPPPVLFVRGPLPATFAARSNELMSCAVVGTRRATRYSLEVAAAVARSLVGVGVLVVSGLALGVDAAAHRGALEAAAGASADGPRIDTEPDSPATVAVLGGGHFHIHPSVHVGLVDRIVAQGGAVISEWPPDVPAARHHFLMRNRIISALARCVLVVEAAKRSGALNTAAHALSQERQLLVVPGRPDDPRYAGNLGLVREGAGVLIEPRDVLEAFGFFGTPSAADAAPRVGGGSSERVPVTWSSPLPTVELGPLAGAIRRVLSAEAAVSLDGLLARLEHDAGSRGGPGSAAAVTALLTALEVTGEVEQTASGRYRLRRITVT